MKMLLARVATSGLALWLAGGCAPELQDPDRLSLTVTRSSPATSRRSGQVLIDAELLAPDGGRLYGVCIGCKLGETGKGSCSMDAWFYALVGHGPMAHVTCTVEVEPREVVLSPRARLPWMFVAAVRARVVRDGRLVASFDDDVDLEDGREKTFAVEVPRESPRNP